ncbi:Tripartite tricarboxylate transporter family receptor [Caballeronia catudaia]|uniref:Tripartite tricarboxylate transporter family receptor n=1 Tax=Caballeronia catudaia TaxID=1777136 RepID=A0A158D9B8_9BURK|nr:tripartite tricarboxylate transporter substrate binding protein [Caballeronia catudaia]SAK90407.1 Tripartite tricarboxylate transporter family receptor [Caballeronia catudaia]
MTRLTRLISGIILSATVAAPLGAWAADDFPTRSIRVIVPVAAGGWGDVTTRVICQRLGEILGQSIIVDNRTGAGGLVGIRYTKEQPADGYTLMSTGSTLAIQQSLNKEPGYDALKDFIDVGTMVRSPALIVTSSKSTYKSLSDLLKDAKEKPGSISYGSAGVGTTTHIAAAMLLKKAGVQMQHVPYKGNGAAMPDVIAGRVSFLIDAYGSSQPGLNGGLLRALAVTSDAPVSVLPNLPTAAQQGVPGFSYYYWLGLFAPAGTPSDRVKKLSDALAKTLNDPKIKSRLQSEGTEPFYASPTESEAFLRKDLETTSQVIKDTGIPKQ